MNEDIKSKHTEIIEKLKRLRTQVNYAIGHIETMPLHDVAMERQTPNRIELGDFVITDRFIEPRG